MIKFSCYFWGKLFQTMISNNQNGFIEETKDFFLIRLHVNSFCISNNLIDSMESIQTSITCINFNKLIIYWHLIKEQKKVIVDKMQILLK